MKKRIEKFIPRALKVARDILFKDNKFPKEFNGYISSFGASIIQSGLLPAVSFYSVKGSAEEDREKIMKAIYFIAIEQGEINPNIDSKKLLEYLINSNENEHNLKDIIIDASIALKLAIRTFDLQ